GDVIPGIVCSLPELRDGSEREFEFPDHCPVCGGKVAKKADEAAYRCVNIACPAQLHQRILHFASRNGADIRGLGDRIVALLLEHGAIEDIAGLYSLTMETLQALPRMGELSSRNLLDSIEASKEIPLNKLIFALGIRHVGERTALILAGFSGTI